MHSQWCATTTSVYFQGIFITSEQSSRLTEQSLLPFPPPSTSGNHQSAFCVYKLTDSGHFIEVKIRGLLCLGPFSSHDVFQVHPCCSTCQNFIPWGGLNNVPCVRILEYAWVFFVYFLCLIVVKYTEHKTYHLAQPVWFSD